MQIKQCVVHSKLKVQKTFLHFRKKIKKCKYKNGT